MIKWLQNYFISWGQTEIQADIIARALFCERLCELSYGLDANGQIEGHLTYLKHHADLADVDAVFCRNYYFQFAEDSEEKNADDLLIAKELKAAFISLDCKWVNAPWEMDSCENKARQMQIALSLGFNVPDLLITNLPKSLLEFSSSQEVVVKQLFNVCVFLLKTDSPLKLCTRTSLHRQITNNWRI